MSLLYITLGALTVPSEENDSTDLSTNDQQKYYLRVNDKNFCIAQLQTHEENTVVHNHKIPEGHGKFLIISVFARRALSWDNYDPDIHCPGSYVIWDMMKTKIHHQPHPRISVPVAGNATDLS